MTAKLQKLVNLALGTNNEGEGSNAARMFFKKLKSLDMKFSSKTWGLTGDQARRLMELGGVQIKGAEPKVEGSRKLADLLKEIHTSYGVDIAALKARAVLRRKMSFYPGTTFNGPEIKAAKDILVQTFC